MGNSRSSLHLEAEELNTLQEETGFSRKQIETLHTRFLRLDKNGKGHLGREDFLMIPELAINPLGDRIVHAFCTLDNTNGEDQVDFRGFLRLLARFQPTGKQCVTVPKMLNDTETETFSGTKYFRFRYRYFFRYQIFRYRFRDF